MTSIPRPLLVLGATWLALALATGASGPSEEASSVELTPRSAQKWTYILPNETWSTIGDQISIPHEDQNGFVVERRSEMKLAIDTDGDGRVDTEVNGVKGAVTLRGKNAEGKPFSYPIRLQNDGHKWTWSVNGVLSTSFKNREILVFDQNQNGRYDDYGQDAMIVGGGESACFLSRVINVGGDLFQFEITSDGRSAKISPFVGETGELDLVKQYSSNGKLVAAVVKSGDTSFNVAASTEPLKVPAGSYALAAGYTARGTESVWIKTGKMQPLEVKAGERSSRAWGAPVSAEFEYSISGDTITVPPDVKFFGSAGEEYHTFKPNAKSPKIIVVDKSTRKELTSGRFGGCWGGGFTAYTGRVPKGADVDVKLEHTRSIFGAITGAPKKPKGPATKT